MLSFLYIIIPECITIVNITVQFQFNFLKYDRLADYPSAETILLWVTGNFPIFFLNNNTKDVQYFPASVIDLVAIWSFFRSTDSRVNQIIIWIVFCA